MTLKSQIEKEKVENAVEAILKVREVWKKSESGKKKSFLRSDEDEFIYLQVQMKKIPHLNKIEMIKVPLPHTLITDSTSICLFTGDLDKKDWKADVEVTIRHYKELLDKLDIKCISEVIPLKQLRTDYKPYEAKRKLLNNFDVFLADSKIAGMLPRTLGKFFFQKRKFPQQVNMKNEVTLKENITKVTSNAVFFLTGKGSTCIASVAHLGHTKEGIINNISSACGITEHIPGGIKNVTGIYVKLSKSMAIPIYICLDTEEVILPSKPSVISPDPEEVSTLSKSKVKVHASGYVELFPDEVSDEDEEFRESEDEMLQRDIVFRKTQEKRKSKTEKRIKKKLKKEVTKSVIEIPKLKKKAKKNVKLTNEKRKRISPFV